jgi:hypothetical protein
MINQANMEPIVCRSSLVSTLSAGPATSSKGVAGSENYERTGTSAPADLFKGRPKRH